MIKYILKKLLGSLLHSKHARHRHSSSAFGRRPGPLRKHSSSDRHSGYGYKQQGHGHYKNRFGRSSS